MTRTSFARWFPALAVWLSAASAHAADWAYWRGPQMNGVSTETNLPETWDPAGGEGSNVLWKRDDLGSRSTPIVLRGRLYLICNANHDAPEEEGERVVCLNAETGETIWEYRFNVYLSDVPRERVGWSSVVGFRHPSDPSQDLVFAQGVCGYFCCLNAATGTMQWEKSLAEEYGFLNTYGGRTNFPLIHENNVIISAVCIGWGDMAKPTHRFIAFDVRNGEPVWFSGTRTFPEDTTYSAPVLGSFGGRLAMVFGSGDGGVHAFEPRTGRSIWSYYVSKHGLNCTPLVVGDRVFCGNSEENLNSTAMGAMFCLDGTKTGDITQTGEVWRIDELGVGRSTPLYVDGRLYVVDDQGKMFILNPETGEQIARQPLGTMMRSSLLHADGKIYACTADGRWYIMKPSEDGVEVLSKGRLASGEECHGSPIAAAGRIYFPSTDAMYCLAKPDAQGEAPETTEGIAESPLKDDETPAWVQVAPVEALMLPGYDQPFDVRLYNAKGRWIRNAVPGEVQLTIAGPGEIERKKKDKKDAAGKVVGQGEERWMYSVDKDHRQHSAVIVTAKFGELTGTARLRVVPNLDWSFNFDDGQVPMTWVGCAYRHIVIDYDLYSKLTQQDPQAGQLYIYLMTGFINTGAPQQVYDNSTPAQRWTVLLRFVQLDQGDAKPKNLEEAKAKLDGSLKLLQDEQVLESYEWSTWDRPTVDPDVTEPDVRLTAKRGPRKVDGNGVLCKITTIPKGMRSQGWMGHPTLHDYTIQADVMGALKNGKLPDIGLTAQRFTMDLMGASQQLQLRTWITQLDHFSVDLPFTWEKDTWYTMKFEASVVEEKARLRGKVWKKGDAEPADWMIVGEPVTANVIGSPGLFGNAKDAELFYDNLTVTANAPSGTPETVGQTQ